MSTHRNAIVSSVDTRFLPFGGLSIYFLTSMVYLLPSGAPQIADVFIFLCAVWTIFCSRLLFPASPLIFCVLGLFVTWIAIVNVTWYIILSDPLFLRNTMFYIFNAVVFLYIVILGYSDQERLARTIELAATAALFIPLLNILIFGYGSDKRLHGSFNNPNQMSYWILLIVTLIMTSRGRKPIRLVDGLWLSVGTYTIMLALSKAASIAMALLVVFFMITQPWRRYTLLIALCVLIPTMVLEITRGGIVERIEEAGAVSALSRRLESIGSQEDDSLAYRGYNRLTRFPQYLILGAGEGSYERLRHNAGAQEFHSTLGNILMSYGMMGFSLFILLLTLVFLHSPKGLLFYLGPLFIYGITHNGMRDSLFWVFLAFVFTHGLQRQGRKSNVEPSG